MTKDTIIAALVAEGLTASQEAFTIPEDREASVLVAAPGDVMSVNKVIRIELREKLLCLHTTKSDHSWFPYDLILGLRFMASKPGKDRVAGFSKQGHS